MRTKVLLTSLLTIAVAGGTASVASVPAPHARPAAAVPDLTGSWRNRVDPSSAPAWQLTASNGLQTLDAAWSGSTQNGHPDLRGTFHTTLMEAGGVSFYKGRYSVSENGPAAGGTITVNIDSSNQIRFTLDHDSGGQEKYTFIRVGGGPPAPTVERVPAPPAFGRTVTAPAPPPGGAALITSPALPSSGAVQLKVSGVSKADVVFAALKHDCYADFVSTIVNMARNAGIEKTSPMYERVLAGIGVFASDNLRDCLALVETLEAFAPSTASAHAAATSCGVTAIAISVRGGRLRTLRVGDRHGSLRMTCRRKAGGLTLTVASRSKGTPLRSVVGSKLRLGLLRSKKSPSSGQLGVTFRQVK